MGRRRRGEVQDRVLDAHCWWCQHRLEKQAKQHDTTRGFLHCVLNSVPSGSTSLSWAWELVGEKALVETVNFTLTAVLVIQHTVKRLSSKSSSLSIQPEDLQL
jgi:hypothetical protein